MPSQPQVVLITGATRGIGRVTALHMAERGHRVMATGRNRELLATLADEAKKRSLPLCTAVMDVTSDADVLRVVAQADEEFGGVSALVNNAGYGLWGPVEELGLDEIRAVFETNLFGLVRVSQAVLPQMRRRKWGTIVNVGSLAGQVVMPASGAYSATKFALEAVSRAMSMELASYGVRIVLLEPGVFATDFHKNVVTGKRVLQPESPYLEHTMRMRTNPRSNNRLRADPIKVATRIRQVIESKRLRARFPVGGDAHLGAMAARLTPDAVMDAVLKKALRW